MEFLFLLEPNKNAFLNLIKQVSAYLFLIAFVYFFFMLEGLVLNYASNNGQPLFTISILLIVFQVLLLFYFAFKIVFNTSRN